MNKFMEAALKARAESDARGPVIWVVTAIVNGEMAEIERPAMAGYEAADQVKKEFGRVRIIGYVEKSVVERNKETNRLNNIVEPYNR